MQFAIVCTKKKNRGLNFVFERRHLNFSAACPSYLSMLLAHVAYLCCMSVLHVRVPFPYCMYIQHVHDECPHPMYMMHDIVYSYFYLLFSDASAEKLAEVSGSEWKSYHKCWQKSLQANRSYQKLDEVLVELLEKISES
jgi:hypothetical protein